jgi:aspartyl-tRNA(Asn)/glutamyl-tRNA(Gln) amidotransferase subunit A
LNTDPQQKTSRLLDHDADGPPDAWATAARLAGGELDARRHTEHALRRTEHARAAWVYITVTAERAAAAAEASHARYSAGRPLSALDGIPVAVKDNLDTEGTVTTAGSRICAARPPARADAAVVRRLTAAGAVLTGKTNLSEFAFSGLGVNPHYGTPVNPSSAPGRPLIAGGSSSGSAVAVALGIVPIALGTDTSGSVRIPASFCGVIGYKASENRYDNGGMVPLAPTLDTHGIFATSMRDITVTDRLLGPVTAEQPRATGPLRLVVPTGELIDDCAPEIKRRFAQALDALAEQGVDVEERKLPVLAQAQSLMDQHGTIVAAEAHQRYGDLLRCSHRDRIDPGVLRRLTEFARRQPRVDLVHLGMRSLRRQLSDELGGGNTLLVCPAVRHLAPPLEPLLADDHAYDLTNGRTLRTTMLLSYLGMPGVSLPIGGPATGNIGFLVSAPAHQDTRLLTASTCLETALRRIDRPYPAAA